MKKLKLALIGCGKLNTVVANAVNEGILPDYELVGAISRDKNTANIFANRYGCRACENIEELLALKPDYTVEAASVGAVKEYSEKVLSCGSHLIVLSLGAFADTNFYERIKKIAHQNEKKIYLPNGAIGGLDIIRTAALMGDITSSIDVIKPPKAFLNTDLYKKGLEDLQGKELLFSGSSADAIKLMPAHVNVAIALALSSNGPNNTHIDINCMNHFIGDKFTINVKGNGVKIKVDIDAENSLLAGWSLVSVLQNITSFVVF